MEDINILLKLYPDEGYNWKKIGDKMIPENIEKFLPKIVTKINMRWGYPTFNVEGNPFLTWKILVGIFNLDQHEKECGKMCGECGIFHDSDQEHGSEQITRKCRCKFLDWNIISTREFITWNIVRKNKKFRWNWKVLSAHENITWKIIKKNPKCPWDSHCVSKNPNLTWDIVRGNIDKVYFTYSGISEAEFVTWDIVMENLDKKLDFQGLSKNPNITWNMVEESLDYGFHWNIHDLYTRLRFPPLDHKFCIGLCIIYIGNKLKSNKTNFASDTWYVSWEIIEKYCYLPWEKAAYNISFNPTVTPEIVENNPNWPWNWGGMSKNPNLTKEFVLKNKDKTWDKLELVCNIAITFEMATLKDFPVDLEGLHLNPNITPEIIYKNIDKFRWNWPFISKELNIVNYVDVMGEKFDWEHVSKNPNITWRFVRKYKDKIDWDQLNDNDFGVFRGACKIQRFWKCYGSFPRWRKAIELVNEEVRYRPDSFMFYY